jgi:hypothetical protein
MKKNETTLKSLSMKLNSIIGIALLIMFVGCDPFDDKLVITNTSEQNVYYTRSPYAKLSTLYRETLEKQGIEIDYQNIVKEVRRNASINELIMGARGKAWQNYVTNVCEDGKLRIYTFNIDTLREYTFKEVIDNNRYLTKKEYTLDDLKKMNWEIKLP